MQAQNYSIRQWPADDRPREKILRKSPQLLSDSEILAILLGTGTRRKSALALAKELLTMGKGSISELGKLGPRAFQRVPGIGEAKTAVLLAALELGRRRQMTGALAKSSVRDSHTAAGFLQGRLQDERREVFAVLFLNQANKVNHFEIVSEGGITGTVADPRIILKKALEEDAVSLILCHNHPSGSLRPSQSDEELTRKIKQAAKYFDIRIMDHIIVSEAGYFSFADEGIL